MILFMNLTGIIPFLNIAGTERHRGAARCSRSSPTSCSSTPASRRARSNFFKNSLFPPGVPWPVYIIVIADRVPLDLHHPADHADAATADEHDRRAPDAGAVLRGDAVLLLHRSAAGWSLLGVGTLAFGLAFTLFEILVAVLQAYVFTILTAVYIQLAVAEEH